MYSKNKKLTVYENNLLNVELINFIINSKNILSKAVKFKLLFEWHKTKWFIQNDLASLSERINFDYPGSLDALSVYINQKEIWQQYKKNKVDPRNVENFFKANLVDQKTNTSCESFNKRQLENLMGQLNNEFDQLGKNQWAVYNCMTHWATHTQDAKNPNNVTRDRENKLVTAPAYMADAAIHEVAAGIEQAVKAVLEMCE